MSEMKSVAIEQLAEMKIDFNNAAHYVFDKFLNKDYADNELKKISSESKAYSVEIIQEPLEDGEPSIKTILDNSKEMQAILDDGKPVIVDGRTVFRPNHGLADTMRVAKGYVPEVVDLLADSTTDQGLKDFCNKVKTNPKLMELLQVAMLFAVTGRRSEVGYSNNEELYLEYRADSEINFRNYCKEQGISEDISNLFAEPLRQMCNPHYKPTAQDPNDAAIQKYLHQIFTTSHELDLLRTYNLDSWSNTVRTSLMKAGVPDNVVVKKLPALKSRVNNLLQQMGDRHWSQDQYVGKYAPPFAELSTDVDQCVAKIDAVMSLKVRVSQARSPSFFKDPAPETNAGKLALISGLSAMKGVEYAGWGALGVGAIYFADYCASLKNGDGLAITGQMKDWAIENAEQLKLAAEVYAGAVGFLIVIAAVAALYAHIQHPEQSKGYTPIASLDTPSEEKLITSTNPNNLTLTQTRVHQSH